MAFYMRMRTLATILRLAVLLRGFAAQAAFASSPREDESSSIDDVSLLQMPLQHEQNASNNRGARSSSLWQSTKQAPQTLCVGGKLVPQIYVLGAPKCGTTSLADDLRAAGVPSNAEPSKESHFFDDWGYGTRDLCNAFSAPLMTAAWLDMHPDCPNDGAFHIIGEYTPDNLRLSPAPPGWRIQAISQMVPDGLRPHPWDSVDEHESCVPSLLAMQLYPGITSSLTFAVMVREPLSRILSAYYFRSEHTAGVPVPDGAFNEDMRIKVKAMQSNIYDTYVWPSMYARQLESYLDVFEASQFVVVPMYYYSDYKCLVFSYISQRIGIDLPCEFGAEAAESNTNSHPPLDEVLDNSTRDNFYIQMQPEIDRLVTLLASNSRSGMMLAGYNAPLGSEDGVRLWLENGW